MCQENLRKTRPDLLFFAQTKLYSHAADLLICILRSSSYFADLFVYPQLLLTTRGIVNNHS